MEVNEKAVRQALADWVGRDGRVQIERSGTGKIRGYIVHPHFTGVSVAERQSWLWQGVPNSGVLDWKGLNALFGEGATEIGMIFAYSPAEYKDFIAEEAQAV